MRPSMVDLHVHHKEKLVVLMGATGTGKSRLSIDLATRFPSEIVNSDKMQVYKGLDIATNKIRDHEKCGVPHHLIDCIDTGDDLSVTDYVNLAAGLFSNISARGRIPILVGGSNSYIQAVVSDDDGNSGSGFRYDCCFIWIDVAPDVLAEFVSRRVDDMIDQDLFAEMADFYDPNEAFEKGIRQAIGVREFASYFHHYPPDDSCESSPSLSIEEEGDWDQEEEKKKKMFTEVVEEMKKNTIKLAQKQTTRIRNFCTCGWDIHRIDATSAFVAGPCEAGNVWERNVVNPALEFVKRFLSPTPTAVIVKMVKEADEDVVHLQAKEQPVAEFS